MSNYTIPVPGRVRLGPRELTVNEEASLSFTADTGLIAIIADGFDVRQTHFALQQGGDGPPIPPVPEHVRIEVGLIPPGAGLPIVKKVFTRHRLASEDDQAPLTYDVGAGQAGHGWRCTVRNVGRVAIRCFALLDYVASHATSPIPWLPNALAPVFWGYEDGVGAPTPLRVLFPTLDGSPQYGRVLPIEHQYPLVVLCHGNCPGETNPYLDWAEDRIAIQLAQAGNVVVVPHLPGIANTTVGPSVDQKDFDLVRSVITWVRTTWSHADVLAPPTGILGHSWGALLAGRLAASGGFQALVSMSGEWADWFNDLGDVLPAITVPSLYIWGTRDVSPLPDPLWSRLIHKPRHKAIVGSMVHFDYLPPGTTPCDEGRGPCPHYRPMLADVLTMFVAKYLAPPTLPDLPDRIPHTLVPPTLRLTGEQSFYAGGYLNGFRLGASDPPQCQMTLSYDIGDLSGSVTAR